MLNCLHANTTQRTNCLLLRLQLFVPTVRPRAERNYKSCDSEDAFKDWVWMTRMCRMCMMATTAGIYYMLSGYCGLVSIHVPLRAGALWIFHMCVFIQQIGYPSLFSSPHTHAHMTLETLKFAPREGKSQPAVSLQRYMTPEVQRSQQTAPEDRRWDALRCNIIMAKIGAKPWTETELWVELWPHKSCVKLKF